MKHQALLAVFFFLPLAATAQSPQLVDDTWAGKKNSDPGSLTVFNNKLYYAATDSLHGRELWVYDIASPLKPQLAVDIAPGTQTGIGTLSTDPMIVYNGKLYGGVAGHKLMQYSGTGTPGYLSLGIQNSNYAPRSFVQLGGKLYFDAPSDTTLAALYSYDGTGTPVMLADLGDGGTLGNTMQMLLPYKGKIYFNGYTMGLCSYDPATNLVQKINVGTAGGAAMFVASSNKLYFAATDSATGQELYSYDGTAVKRLTDIAPGPASGVRFRGAWGTMAFYNGAVYFEATTASGHNALYKWDEAAQAASLVYDFVTDGNITLFYVAGNNLYFKAYKGNSGYELWRCNGSTCAMVADLYPGAGMGMGSTDHNSNFAVYHGSLYFSGDNGVTGSELYRLPDESITGIQSVRWNGKATLYPNPATSSATLTILLQSPESLRVAVTDAAGKEVFTTGQQTFASGSNEIMLPIERFAAGQYFYHVHGSSGNLLATGSIAKQ